MKKILLIEDNREMRENTTEILELAQYQVFAAENGKIGVELALKEHPDLVICDIMMPVLDGYGVLHMLSKNPETAGIPFIFLTAKADRGDFRKGMEMGADDYVTKPFDDVELMNAIESRLKRAEIIRKEFMRDMDGLNSFFQQAKGTGELEKLSEQRDVRKFNKKGNVYTEGAYPRGLYFINKGKVKTYKTHELGKELITGLYKEGEFFGYLPLMGEAEYTDSAEALEESEICFIPREDFAALMFKNATVSKKFIQMLSNDLAEKEEQLLNLAYTSVRKRVAEALVLLHNRYGKEGEDTFKMHISREDLAQLVGTATETTIRTLGDFRDEKLIEIKGSNISILNVSKLAQLRH